MFLVKLINEFIVVIGFVCCFVGGFSSFFKLWDLFKEFCDVLKDILDSCFSVEGFYYFDGLYYGCFNVKVLYFIEEDVWIFDVQFFGIKFVEVGVIDLQQCLLLEMVYEVFELVGQLIQSFCGSDMGVYVGQMCSDFEFLVYCDFDELFMYCKWKK